MKKRPKSWVAALFVVVLAGILYYAFGNKAPDASKLTQYKIAKAEKGTVKKTVSATGTLQPWKVVDIKSKAGGRVLEMKVDVGTQVRPGQEIARIDPSDTNLAYSQAEADTQSSIARTTQSKTTYELTKKQTAISIANAQSALDSARESLATAQSRRDAAKRTADNQTALTKASIEQAQANYNQAVTSLDQLQATQAQTRSSAQSAYDSAVANANNSEKNLNRQQSLLAKGFVSQQVVDAAQASNDVAQASVNSAKTKLDTLGAELKADVDVAKSRVAQAKAALNTANVNRNDIQAQRDAYRQAENAVRQANAQVAQADLALTQAKLNAANNQLRNLDITSAKAAEMRSEATLKNAKDTLDQTTVRSPSEGVVLTKYVDQGTIITSGLSLNSTGSSIVQLGVTTRMFVDVTVDETDIASVDDGQTVDVSFDAYPGVPFEGKVARIDPQAVVTQNVTNIHVRVEIDNSSPTFRLLKPGMNATCDFVVDNKDNVIAVPNSAVQTDDNGSYVQIASGGTVAPVDPASGLTVDPNTLVGVKLTRRPIEVGVLGNDTTEVTSGLKEGEVIVVETIEPATTTPQASTPFAGGGGRPGGGGRGR
ncbi:MAG TPA: efflux RND transporter periplasmic adaptor subunit [Armatimonadota bacterium]